MPTPGQAEAAQGLCGAGCRKRFQLIQQNPGMVLIVRAMGETSMVEPLLLGMVFVLASLLLWLLADSDDDNGGGGLRQPVLVPIPVRHHQR